MSIHSLYFQRPAQSVTNKGFAFNPTKFWEVLTTVLSIALKVLYYYFALQLRLFLFHVHLLKNLNTNTNTFATLPAHPLLLI